MTRSGKQTLAILLVTTSFPVGNNRASGAFIKRLADSFAHKAQIRVVTPSPSDSGDMVFNYPVHYFRYAPRKYQKLAHHPGGIPVALRNDPWTLILLPGFIIAMFFSILKHGRRVDVIHANWGVPGLISALAALIIHKPVVTTLRGSDVSGLEGSLATRIIINMVLRLSKRVISVNKSIQGELSGIWPGLQHKIAVIPNGVDEDLLQIKHNEHTTSHVHLLTVGNLVANKDISTIIRAFPQLSGTVSLTIVGDGKERSVLEQLCEYLEITDLISFLGIVPPDKIKAELEKTDIFVLASHSEGRPNVILEAMAAGCAIVATKITGITEIIENEKHGLLFAPGDIQSLASILNKLIDNPDRIQQLGRQGRDRVLQMNLSWNKCADAYIHEYVKAIAT